MIYLALLVVIATSLGGAHLSSPEPPGNEARTKEDSAFLARLLRRHGQTHGQSAVGLRLASGGEDDEDCAGDATCSRAPDADTVIPSVGGAAPATDYGTRFDLTGGTPGVCQSPTCSGGPCKWSFKIELNNNSAGPNANNPGATGTMVVKIGTYNRAMNDSQNFANFTLAGAITVTAVNPSVGAVTPAELTIPCDTNSQNSVQTVLAHLTVPGYSWTEPVQGGQPIVHVIPAVDEYRSIDLICSECPVQPE